MVLCCPLSLAKDFAADTGFIFQLQGNWIDTRTGQVLQFGEKVFPNEQIAVAENSKRDGSISIALYDGTAVKLTCPQDCARPYAVEDKRSSPDGWTARIGKAWTLLFPQEVAVIVPAGVRGAGLREAVLPVRGGVVNLVPVLANVKTGRYDVEFRRWTQSGPVARSVAFALDWRRTDATLSSSPSVEPGLYQLTLVDGAGNAVGGALVLLVPDAAYNTTNRAFERARAISERWAANVGDAVAHRFIVECLIVLSRDPNLARDLS